MILVAMIFVTNISAAQSDADDCKDHPLLTRMNGYYIEQCSDNYNAVPLPMSKDDNGYIQKEIEGNVTTIVYYSDNEKLPTGFQVIKNYETAILNKGGKKVFSYTGSGLQPVATFGKYASGK